MKALLFTQEMLLAAGRDAGNRSMRKAGRSRWNRADFNAACDEHDKLTPFLGELPAPMKALIDRTRQGD